MKILKSYSNDTEKPQFVILFETTAEKESFLEMTDGEQNGIIKFEIAQLHFHGTMQSFKQDGAMLSALEK
jgi:hypothetical protein